MKLRNKKTGEIVEFKTPACMVDEKYSYQYDSLAELTNEWEDYKEPKEYWFINSCGIVQVRTEEEQPAVADMHKQFGNHFETKEEAERVVEKPKAWKRLKDGGVTFKNWIINQTGTIDCFATWGDNIPPSRKDPILQEDLDLLFGGEE